MKLSEMIKTAIEAKPRNFTSKDFDVDGKTVVKYTEDFTIDKDDAGKDQVIIDDTATFIKASDTVHLTVPMPCIAALKLDKSFSSRRWLATDLTDAEKYAASVMRGKGAAMNLSLEIQKLKIKAYNKAKSAKLGLSKSGNVGLTLLDNDLDTLLNKIDTFKEEVTAYFTGTVENEVDEDF